MYNLLFICSHCFTETFRIHSLVSSEVNELEPVPYLTSMELKLGRTQRKVHMSYPTRKMKKVYVVDSIFDTKNPDMIHNHEPIP